MGLGLGFGVRVWVWVWVWVGAGAGVGVGVGVRVRVCLAHLAQLRLEQAALDEPLCEPLPDGRVRAYPHATQAGPLVLRLLVRVRVSVKG